jgi:hypothetical protein
METPVLQDEGDLELAPGQAESFLGGVANDVGAGQPRVDVEPGDRDRVIVVPLHARVIVVGVADDRFVGFGPPRVQGGLGRAVNALRGEPLRRNTSNCGGVKPPC